MKNDRLTFYEYHAMLATLRYLTLVFNGSKILYAIPMHSKQVLQYTVMSLNVFLLTK